MRYTLEQFNEKYALLNANRQAFIGGEDADTHIAVLASSYNLTRESWRALGAEVGYILVGLEPMAKFTENVKNNVRVDEATALKIVTEVEKRIFVPYMDLDLPATLEEAPEREVTLRKIITPNPVLNKQLEVPIVHPLDLKEQAIESLGTRVPLRRESAPVASPTPVPAPVSAPVAPKTADQSILGARLGGSFNIPREEIKISSPKPPQTPQNSQPGASQPSRYAKDPYRESID